MRKRDGMERREERAGDKKGIKRKRGDKKEKERTRSRGGADLEEGHELVGDDLRVFLVMEGKEIIEDAVHIPRHR